DFLPFDKFLFGKAIYLNNLFFLIKSLFLKFQKNDLIYTRSPEIAWLFSLRKHNVFFEAHNWPCSKSWIYKKMLKNVKLLVCNSNGTADHHIKNGLNNVMVCHNGVDLEKFSINFDKSYCKKKIGFSDDDTLVMYVGHLYDWKGADILAKSADFIEEKIKIVFVGGSDVDIYEYKKKYNKKNIIFVGKKKHEEIPCYLRAADILVLPNIPISEESVKFTSPIKMFEYMSSGTPIIASNLPSIKEILNKDNSILFNPGNERELSEKIIFCLKNKDIVNKISQKALSDVQNYSWLDRAKKIIEKYESIRKI
ncbi:MAG TPA: glycosyltransferase family 4 protein, partial [bacterium]|nr:glycosyltransferase family 4 protein [bacterium]